MKIVSTYNRYDDTFRIEDLEKYLKHTREEVMIGDTKLSRCVLGIFNTREEADKWLETYNAEVRGERNPKLAHNEG